MKKVLILVSLLIVMISACDLLPGSEELQVTPPADADVADVGYLSKVIFDIQDAINGNYRAVVGGVEFSCRTYEDHPDQLYCFGPELPVGEYEAEIYLDTEEQPVFVLPVVVSGNIVVVTATPLPATATPEATSTPLPPPTATATTAVTQPVSSGPAPTSAVATPVSSAPTLDPKDSLKVFYFNLDETGRYGCGEAMYWVQSTQRIGPNMADNITEALRMLLIYHQPYFGELYNPYGASDNQFAVNTVEILPEGGANVFLTGTYDPPEELL